MPNKTLDRLDSLPTLTKANLLQLYGELFKTAHPVKIRRDLLERIIAYGLQAQHFGGLHDGPRRHLQSLREALHSGSDAELSGLPHVKPGTRLIREWKNQTHVVTVEQSGFQYQGCRYESLSEIARTITGTRWSGPLFFGLKNKKVQSVENRHEC